MMDSKNSKNDMKPESKPVITSFTGQFRWLSNFEPSRIMYDGYIFETVEHAYQAQKALFPHVKEWIRNSDGPREAKFRGRQCTMRSDWEEIKDQVMLDCTRLKYALPDYRTMLLATQGWKIVEGNYWGDTYWGICGGKGFNVLGQIIMHVRQEIRENQKIPLVIHKNPS